LWAQISIRYAGQSEWTNTTLNYYLGESYGFGDPRIGSIAVGFIGLIISILGQIIFPASWRSFIAVFALAIKQIADVLLPECCASTLPLFAGLVFCTINKDREKQVSIIIKDYLSGEDNKERRDEKYI
jgi:hypothetical protein